jgi:hypothetical protein
MGTYIMEFHTNRHLLIKEVQEEFSRNYPFLKIEFSKRKSLSPEVEGPAADGQLSPGENTGEEQTFRATAKNLLWNDFSLSDTMTVSELEVLLQYQFGLPVQILRKSGNLWMETRLTRQWTLRQQNDHGADIAF